MQTQYARVSARAAALVRGLFGRPGQAQALGWAEAEELSYLAVGNQVVWQSIDAAAMKATINHCCSLLPPWPGPQPVRAAVHC